MAERIGQRLGNYRLVRLLGTGGFAEVYLGEHIYLKSQAAIKVLYTHLAHEEVAGFLSEAQTLVRLIHPHIVRLLDFGVQGNTPFLVMDYAPNGTLRQCYPKGERLPLATIVGYVKQVADALQYAHDEKLIHRDIKPENMLLGRRNEVVLSDFGIAVVAQSSRYDRTQDAGGTIAYMAPEQIQAHPRPASDQYALGVVVYEWLSGERPFRGSFTEIAAKHVLAPPPSLREMVSAIPSAIEQVVMTALAKDPKQRFGSVQAFATALEQAAQSPSDSPSILPTAIAPSNELSRPPELGTPSNQALQPTHANTSLSESVIPTELIMRPQSTAQPIQMSPSPNQTSGPPELWTPASQAFQPTNAAPPPDLLARPPVIATPPSQYIPQPIPLQPAIPYTPKRGVSRRTIILGLAGLVVAGGGIAWFSASHGLVSSPANNSSASSSPGGIKAGPGVDLATKTINLGILSPFSGPVAAPIGDPLARGVEVFFKSVNDHGGIDGFKVKPD